MSAQGSITRHRVIRTCSRCRQHKLGCDQAKPRCSRCVLAGVNCSFESRVAVDTQEDSISEGSISQFTPSLDQYLDVDSEGLPLSPVVSEYLATPITPLSLFEDQDSSHVLHVTESEHSESTNKQIKQKRRKRDRTRFSCERCHRMKVKCDQKQPCSRCKTSRRPSECIYNPSINSYAKFSAHTSISVPNVDSGKSLHEQWHSKYRGDSHWKALIKEIEQWPDNRYWRNSTFDPRIRSYQALPLPWNFPLGGGDSAYSATLEKILSWIPERQQVDRAVENYLNIFERNLRILHVPSFKQEIAKFWENPLMVDISWLAQFLTVLGLGFICETRGLDSRSRRLFDGAQVCLGRTTFTTITSMVDIQTLCLMILARLATATSGGEMDSCWTLSGLVNRLAIGLGFHVHNQKGLQLSVFELEMRRRLWTTIIFFEILLSLISGTPFLIREEDFTCPPPSNINDEDMAPDKDFIRTHMPCEHTETSQHILYFRTFPVIFKVMHSINSASNKLSYADTITCNNELRAFLAEAKRLSDAREIFNSQNESVEYDRIQRATLDIFFRRILIVLHRPYAQQPDAATNFPVSYFTSLESSLAVLVHQREALEVEGLSPILEWYAQTFRQDYFVAALMAIIHLNRNKASFELSIPSSCLIPPRQTIIETLKSCTEIWGRVKHLTICNERIFYSLERVVTILEENGDLI